MKRSFYTKNTNHYKMHKKVHKKVGKGSRVTWIDPRCGKWIDNPRNLTYDDDKVTCLSCIWYMKRKD